MSALFDHVTASFTVRTLADPHAVGRLLGLFAQQELIPSAVRVRRLGSELSVSIQQPAISEKRAEVIAEEMRCMVAVAMVGLECQVGTIERCAA